MTHLPNDQPGPAPEQAQFAHNALPAWSSIRQKRLIFQQFLARPERFEPRPSDP
jgi:hypothetical protein